MKLLQVPTVALEQRIKEELEINPALEEGQDENEENEPISEDPFASAEDDSKDEHEDQNREDFNLDAYIDDDETPAYKLQANNYSPDDERKEIPFAGGISFQEHLIQQLQLRDLDAHEFAVAEYLIGNLDEDGYLRRELFAICDDLAFSQNIIKIGRAHV